MTSDYRITSGLIHDILDALERHGYYRSDDQHADRAIGLIGDLAGIYEGTQDYPAGTHLITVSSSLPADPGRSGRDAVILTGADVSTVLTALDIAADYQRERADMCADCRDQSCPACQHRLRDAQACDRLAGRIFDPARTVGASPPEPGGRPDPAAGKEAGQ
jgi:hypothetical protein